MNESIPAVQDAAGGSGNKEPWFGVIHLSLGHDFRLRNLRQVAPLPSLSFPNCKVETTQCPHQAVCGTEMGQSV